MDLRTKAASDPLNMKDTDKLLTIEKKNIFLICFPMDYRDFSVKSKVIISLFQTVRL